MPTEIKTWDLINAYVDGELDRSASAEIAAAAASDPSLAARIATLSRLKASMPQPDVLPASKPSILSIGPTSRFKVRQSMAVAAAVAIMAMLTGLFFRSHFSSNEYAWLSDALASYEKWTPPAVADETDFGSQVAISAVVLARPLDLSDAELKLVYAAKESPLGSGKTIFLGYRGSHGCLVGLWTGPPQDNISQNPKSFDQGSILVRAWSNDDRGYVLLSRGMDPAKLDRLATAVADLTKPSRGSEEAARVALREVPRTGMACRV